MASNDQLNRWRTMLAQSEVFARADAVAEAISRAETVAQEIDAAIEDGLATRTTDLVAVRTRAELQRTRYEAQKVRWLQKIGDRERHFREAVWQSQQSTQEPVD